MQEIMIFKSKNLKSFDGDRDFEIRPITIVTGENSSGKTAFIQLFSAAYRTISKRKYGGFDPYFSSYEDIATYKGGRYGRDAIFGFGLEQGKGAKRLCTYIECKNEAGASSIKTFQASLGADSIEINAEAGKFILRIDGGDNEFDIKKILSQSPSKNTIKMDPLRILYNINYKSESIDVRRAETIIRMQRFRLAKNQITEFAPIRAKPQKYYDGLPVDEDSTGSQTPYLLKRFYNESLRDDDLKKKFHQLKEFGIKSGLFEWIGTRKLGKSSTDPFQILVSQSGPQSNMPDVGYGVNQALPIVAHLFFSAQSNEKIVIQQPEVHLHPRAQAELGSLFVKIRNDINASFIIETHSDYLIDRIRVAIREGKLLHSDFQILHFTKKRGSTNVSAIHVNENGQYIDVPDGYRDFFLREQMVLLGVDN